ncbi:MAG: molecular chaperone HtpG [Bacteroidales bacterium]|jgi:molecular chaperone HtpG|nr:molecular chaperone HtpG [Bacteroidales bacterium]
MKGQISVKTENIFPIIKQFLYSDHDIFLREIVSNAVDATMKLRTLASLGQYNKAIGEDTIDILLDKKKKTLSIIDRGIGMTKEEVEKYITNIALSGAEEFIEKFKGKNAEQAAELIGHFGLGFFSSFMVSDKVEIDTLSYLAETNENSDIKPVHWVCDGSEEYEIEEGKWKERGTKITMHIAKESEEFLEESKILDLLKKYCRFMPVTIRFGKEKVWVDDDNKKDKDGKPERVQKEQDRIINNTNPLWKRKPAELTDEDYKAFYRELYPMSFDEPLFHIHLNVDYPFNLTGILFFPKIQKNIEPTRDKIQLYCNQVFVTDSVEGVVPEYMMLLRGVLDSPDIPLNVSRSYLQSDANVKKIAAHISKKVADKLEEISNNNHEEFEKKFEDLRIFIEYGMLSDEKFCDKMEKIFLYRNMDNNFFTFNDYKKKIELLQTDKDKRIIILYTSAPDEQYSYIQTAKDKGYDVLIMDGILDNHFVNLIEQREKNIHFARIDSDVIEKLICKDEEIPSKLSKEQCDKLKQLVEAVVDKQIYNVKTESLEETAKPMTITQDEYVRRMKQMYEMGGSPMAALYGNMPNTYNLVVNVNNPLIVKALDMSEVESQTKILSQLKDLALLSQGLLKGKELDDFISRSEHLIEI